MRTKKNYVIDKPTCFHRSRLLFLCHSTPVLTYLVVYNTSANHYKSRLRVGSVRTLPIHNDKIHRCIVDTVYRTIWGRTLGYFRDLCGRSSYHVCNLVRYGFVIEID